MNLSQIWQVFYPVKQITKIFTKNKATFNQLIFKKQCTLQQLHHFNIISQKAILYLQIFKLVSQIIMDDSIGYHTSTAIIIIVFNSISFLSLLFVLIIYIARWKQITSLPLRLSFYLCIACLIQNFYVIIFNPILVDKNQDQQNTSLYGYCVFEAVLKVSSDLSSIIWTTLIIFSSYASVVMKKEFENVQISYLIVAYLFPVIVSIIPIFFGLYGYDTYYCWFDQNNRNLEFILEIIYYYAPLWICFIATMILSYKVYKTLKQIGLDKKQLLFFKRLMLFPLIMLSTGLFSTINKIYMYVTDDHPQWLDDLANIGVSLYGVFNAMAYGFNPKIRQQMYIFFKLNEKKTKNLDAQMSELQSRYSRQTYRFSQFIN